MMSGLLDGRVGSCSRIDARAPSHLYISTRVRMFLVASFHVHACFSSAPRCVVPQEYGISEREKYAIGSKVHTTEGARWDVAGVCCV